MCPASSRYLIVDTLFFLAGFAFDLALLLGTVEELSRQFHKYGHVYA